MNMNEPSHRLRFFWGDAMLRILSVATIAAMLALSGSASAQQSQAKGAKKNCRTFAQCEAACQKVGGRQCNLYCKSQPTCG